MTDRELLFRRIQNGEATRSTCPKCGDVCFRLPECDDDTPCSRCIDAGVPDIGRRAAVHESGHAVVADALGFDVISIEPKEDGGWATAVRASPDPAQQEHYAMAVYSLAGGCAEQAAGLEPDDGCVSDMNFAAKHMHRWLGGGEDDVTEAADREMIDVAMRQAHALAEQIVGARWESIEALAERVLRDGQLTSDGAFEFFRGHWPPCRCPECVANVATE